MFPGKKERKFRKIVSRIGANMKTTWKKGARRMEERLEWIRRKLGPEAPSSSVPGQGKETFGEWTDRMAEGSGARRQRIKVQVPVFGTIHPELDEDELDFLRLPPKFNTYPKVTVNDVSFQHSIGGHKARWTRQSKRDYDAAGNDVTEEDEARKT